MINLSLRFIEFRLVVTLYCVIVALFEFEMKIVEKLNHVQTDILVVLN